MRYLRCWVLAFAPLAMSAFAQVPDWSVQAVRVNLANQVFTRLRDQLQQQGSAAAKILDTQVALSIDMRVGEDTPLEPHSVHGNNGRKVVVPDGFIAKTINLARLSQLVSSAGELECVATYKAHMEDTGSRTAPEAYLDLTEPTCAAFKARLPLTPEQETRAQRQLEATLVFAYLHELGHQFHNHWPPPMPYNVNTKENQCAWLRARDLRRQLEYEADSFAVETLGELGQIEVVLGTTSLWVPRPLGQNPAEIASNEMLKQRLADHPYSPFRLVRILDQASAALSRRAGDHRELLQTITQMVEVERRGTAVIAESDAEMNRC